VRTATPSNGFLTLVSASEDAGPAARGAQSGPSRVLLTMEGVQRFSGTVIRRE